MPKIYKNLTELIGNTPLVELKNVEKSFGLKARLVAKVESFNPGGSVKDRVALAMIDDAVHDGRLSPGATIIEPTSGNTGIGLAWVASLNGYKVVLTMPDTMSHERRMLLEALGARIVLTPGAEGMKGAIAEAEWLHRETPGSIIPGQFDNPSNPAAHERTTAQEIWRDTDGEVDIIVAGVGTGGTISGTARGLKSHNPAIKAVAVEPASSAVLEGKPAGKHAIQGIGAGFVPVNFDRDAIDEIMAVTDEDAKEGARTLSREEGLLAGVSAGAAFHAAVQLARMEENVGRMIVVILPDTGDRYLSTDLFTGNE